MEYGNLNEIQNTDTWRLQLLGTGCGYKGRPRDKGVDIKWIHQEI